MSIARFSDLTRASLSVVDDVGGVYFFENRVLRLIENETHAWFYKELLQRNVIQALFNEGLVPTWICEDLMFKNNALVLEHEAIPFQTHPVENTNRMHWDMADVLVDVCARLGEEGLGLKDAHPWNMMIRKGKPVFVDFGSIVKSERRFFVSWIQEFYKYFAVPIWIAASRWPEFSRQYRKEHHEGFGITLFGTKYLRKIVWGQIFSMVRKGEDNANILRKVKSWLIQHKPTYPKAGQWANYPQYGNTEDPLKPVTTKETIVHKILTEENPKTVLDCGANVGFYAEMASRLGAKVVAFDDQERVVDTLTERVVRNRLQITPVHMDFRFPTPSFGLALTGKSALDRYQCECVLALASIHHLCIKQQYPVRLFCETCILFSERLIMLEFVSANDIHLKGWAKMIPEDYDEESIVAYFDRCNWSLAERVPIEEGGLQRAVLKFSRASTSELMKELA